MSTRRIYTGIGLIALALAFGWYVSKQPMDFRVYYYGSHDGLTGIRPIYGEKSGLGWPMHYRYPPLFLFLVAPLTMLPLPLAAAVWAVLKCAALFGLTLAVWKRLGPSKTPMAWLVPLLLAGPYVIEDIRYGNAQSFVFALTAGALLALPAMPLLAGAALALGIITKVWPLFFVPYLAARREWKVVSATILITVILALAPSLYFGFGENLNLLQQWAHQEFATQTGQSEIWFPSQSLRGVFMRYLTAIDYSEVPDSNYPLVHIATFDPASVRTLWMIAVGLLYAGFLLVSRQRQNQFGMSEALAFSAIILLQPFSQKYALVVLLWPALVAARLAESNRMRGLLYAATAITVVQPLVKGAAAQRLMQVLGFDFLATALLAAFIVVSMLSPVTGLQGAVRRYYSPDTRTP